MRLASVAVVKDTMLRKQRDSDGKDDLSRVSGGFRPQLLQTEPGVSALQVR